MTKTRPRGFTLVEMLVVVAILGILSVLAVTVYKRYTTKAKTSEAMAMLSHIKAKQEAYQGEHYRYAHIPAFYPSTVKTNEKVPFGPLPVEWLQLGIQANSRAVYFQYQTVSDQGNVANAPPGGTGLVAGQPWFVARAQASFESAGGTPDTTFEIVSNRDTVWKVDVFGNRGP
jgi:prepilin-type N-terminal cleavage/methylation domain-containing protein